MDIHNQFEIIGALVKECQTMLRENKLGDSIIGHIINKTYIIVRTVMSSTYNNSCDSRYTAVNAAKIYLKIREIEEIFTNVIGVCLEDSEKPTLGYYTNRINTEAMHVITLYLGQDDDKTYDQILELLNDIPLTSHDSFLTYNLCIIKHRNNVKHKTEYNEDYTTATITLDKDESEYLNTIFYENINTSDIDWDFFNQSKTINYAAIFPDGYGISVIISGTPFDTDINKNEENFNVTHNCRTQAVLYDPNGRKIKSTDSYSKDVYREWTMDNNHHVIITKED